MISSRLRRIGARSAVVRLPARKPSSTSRPRGASTSRLSANAGPPSTSRTTSTGSPTASRKPPGWCRCRRRARTPARAPASRRCARCRAPWRRGAWRSAPRRCRRRCPPRGSAPARRRQPPAHHQRVECGEEHLRDRRRLGEGKPAGIGSASSWCTTTSSACAPPPTRPMTRSPTFHAGRRARPRPRRRTPGPECPPATRRRRVIAPALEEVGAIEAGGMHPDTDVIRASLPAWAPRRS